MRRGLSTVAVVLALAGCGTRSPALEVRSERAPIGASTIVHTAPVPEPGPYAIESDSNGEVDTAVRPGTVSPPRPGELSVPWSLDRVFDGGRKVQLINAFGPCGRASFQESADAVLVQVVQPPTRGCTSFFVLNLSAPLGDRVLLHAPTSLPTDTRSLADRFSPAAPYPGPPWYRGGREVLRRELSVGAGPAHCGWEAATTLGGTAFGRVSWTRDPEGVLEHAPDLQAGFRAHAALPGDARATGYTSGALELWRAASDRGAYVYLVNALDRTDVERWVRSTGPGCA